MLISLPANPVPAEMYEFVRGGSSRIWLPWHVWGGGVYATKYDYDTTKHIGYLGTVSVPFQAAAGGSVVINSLRVTASVSGKIGSTEGAMLMVGLHQRTGGFSRSIATVYLDRRTETVTNSYVDITQSAGGFVASPSVHSLAIELVGEGQGFATVDGLFVDLSY